MMNTKGTHSILTNFHTNPLSIGKKFLFKDNPNEVSHPLRARKFPHNIPDCIFRIPRGLLHHPISTFDKEIIDWWTGPRDIIRTCGGQRWWNTNDCLITSSVSHTRKRSRFQAPLSKVISLNLQSWLTFSWAGTCLIKVPH